MINVTGAPARFMYMPGGKHTIMASKGGRPYKTTVLVDPASAQALQTSLNKLKGDRAPHSPWFDFNHSGDKASAHPQRFTWDTTPEPGVYVEAAWTKSGRDAVTATDGEVPEYQGFSGQFFTDRGAKGDGVERITEMDFDGGGLVNSPAFRKNRPVNSSEPQSLWCNENTVTETEDDKSESAFHEFHAQQNEAHAASAKAHKISDGENHTDAAEAHVVAAGKHTLLNHAFADEHPIIAKAHEALAAAHHEYAKDHMDASKDCTASEAAVGDRDVVHIYENMGGEVKAEHKASENLNQPTTRNQNVENITGITYQGQNYAVTAMGGDFYKLDRPLHGSETLSLGRINELVANGAVTTGDFPGHAFHGNQHAGGASGGAAQHVRSGEAHEASKAAHAASGKEAKGLHKAAVEAHAKAAEANAKAGNHDTAAYHQMMAHYHSSEAK